MPVYRLEIATRAHLRDALGEATQRRLIAAGVAPSRVSARKVYHLDLEIDDEQAARILAQLVDPITEVGALGKLDDPDGAWLLTVGLRPGVTDSVGHSVARAAADCLGRPLLGGAYASILYILEGIDEPEARRAGRALHNPLIERLRLEAAPRALVDLDVPRAGAPRAPEVALVPLRAADDAQLLEISRAGVLSLSLLEMQAIQRHFAEELGRDPTDAELECLAQTWSEHCKHKIFASPIDYTDPQGQRRRIDRGLFRASIRGATEAVAESRRALQLDPPGEEFLVSVFHDNAGVVRFTERDHLVYKVETHNSPSALDPYGGAMTGVVGVNRDSLGTGLGAELLTNVWAYCFGEPDHRGALPPGLLHPARIREGVHHGVIDGGNHSGIPYSRGLELFDARYAGKPLVYCGTVAVMPVLSAGRPTAVKRAAVGDHIVMLGGRIGKDGIHGATFSSVELGDDSPTQAVQIGDPITQKMMADFLHEAREAALYSSITDNGAGGLSSSVGEMALATGGAELDLELAPLKYPGLAPWEILISEAQERMTLAVPPESLAALLELAARREVEATALGRFTDSGRLVVRHAAQLVCDLSLDFLHEGAPLPALRARWSPPPRPLSPPGALARACPEDQLGATLLALLRRPNLASNEAIARRYDHEVKGLSVIKPWVGVRRDVPATATVMRVRHGRPEGVVLAEGIHPYYSDIDAEAMAHAALDEAVRRVLCAGARYDRLAALDNFCWPDPVQSERTPDGEHKLAQLVRCCEGLRAACEAYGVPLISGKDSMKNDALLGGVKISIPPTLLCSVLGQMTDVRRALELTPIGDGDLVYALGPVADELGASELERHLGLTLDRVPRTDLAAGSARYRAFVASRDAGLVRSAHVIGRGGLAVALAHLTLAGERGLDLDLTRASESSGLDLTAQLFSESTGRILFTAPPSAAAQLHQRLRPHGLSHLGHIAPSRGDHGWLRISSSGRPVLELDSPALRTHFQAGLDDPR